MAMAPSRFHSKRLLAGAFLTLGSLTWALACGGTEGGGSTFGGSSAGKGGSGAGTGADGAAANGGTGLSIVVDSSPGSGGQTVTDANACEGVSEKADLVPLDLYIMLDRSGSMVLGQWWDDVVSALKQFIGSPASTGLGVGLQVFPGSPECMLGTYSTPRVPIEGLPANKPNLENALDQVVPGGQTPTRPALEGAIGYMTEWLLRYPAHRGVVVLATDGQPNNCASDVESVAQVARDGADQNPKVLTFVIGVGLSLANLDAIAQAGGTEKAFLVDTAGNVADQFIQALDAIRGGSVACEYLIPTPASGTIDKNKVNVSYQPSAGGDPESFPKAFGAADCGTSEAWFYDDEAAPTKVVLCPAACAKVKGDAGATVSVVFGCETTVKPPS
jgi:hypothetical protein